jgi:hypothetical protein
MRVFIQRVLWGGIWAATMAITFLLCADMAKDQPILLAIIVLAAIVQSIALVYARIHWRDNNKTSAFAALFVGLLCLGVSIVSEVSYWSGTIEGVHNQIQRERDLIGGQDLVKERRRAQLAQAVGGKLPAQIEAEIAVAANRAELRALKAQLHAARELEKLQGQVIADSTETVNYSIKRSFYEAAALGSENLGGNVKAWILGEVTLLVLCMLSLHVLSLYIAFAPTRPRAARTAAKAEPAPTVAASPFSDATEPPMWLETKITTTVTKEPEAPTDPEPPKPTRKDEPPRPTEPFVPRVVETTPLKPRTKAERQEAVVELTRRWFKDCATKTSLLFGTPAKHAYKNYVDWCHDNHELPVSDSHFGRSVRRLKIEAGKTAQGATYGLQLQRGGRSAARAIA